MRGQAPALFGSKHAYSSRVHENTLPPTQAALDTPLRAHKDHPWVTLHSATVEKPDGTRHRLLFWRNGERTTIDYESSADFTTHPVMSHARAFVMLKNERGEEIEWITDDYSIFHPKGGWALDDSPSFPPGLGGRGFPAPVPFGGRFAQSSFTPNMELFVVLEDRFDPQAPLRFKISNSLSIGDKVHVTLARDWTDDEAKRIDESVKAKTGPTPGEKAPVITQPNSAPGTGPVPNSTKSKLVGGTGGSAFESAKAGTAVVGFNYRFGSWDNNPAIAGITPLYGPAATPPNEQQIVAKDGYAVGGLRIELQKYVSGMQVVFMRLKPDGQLDPNDQYESNWIRATPAAAAAPTSLLSEGKKVIGIYGRAAAVVDAMGLVLE
jgi:hypothetical protein